MGSVWRDARTIGDLGQHMAGWLEGRVPSWPGYDGPFGQEEANGARHLIPTLAAANRAGYVTTCSQPAADSGVWRQRAWVEGFVHDRSPLLGRLLGLQRQGFIVLRGWPKEMTVVTEQGGEPVTTLGGFRLPRNEVTRCWSGTGRLALRELHRHGAMVHVIDPVWGRDDRLWPALANATR